MTRLEYQRLAYDLRELFRTGCPVRIDQLTQLAAFEIFARPATRQVEQQTAREAARRVINKQIARGLAQLDNNRHLPFASRTITKVS